MLNTLAVILLFTADWDEILFDTWRAYTANVITVICGSPTPGTEQENTLEDVAGVEGIKVSVMVSDQLSSWHFHFMSSPFSSYDKHPCSRAFPDTKNYTKESPIWHHESYYM